MKKRLILLGVVMAVALFQVACDASGPETWTESGDRAADDHGIGSGDALGDDLAGAVLIRLSHTDWLAGSSSPSRRTADVSDKAEMEAFEQLLDAEQTIGGAASRCYFGYELAFLDADGTALATVGLCKNDAPVANQRGVLVRWDDNGKLVERRNIVIPDGASLVDRMETHL